MPLRLLALLSIAAVFAASGQILFKLGATGRSDLPAFFNPAIVLGLVAYGLGTAAWIYALSVAPLTKVYPFTALTFVLTYLMAAVFFREIVSLSGVAGILLILGGLFLVTRS